MATPGKTNNPNGRPKGKPNKVTGELRVLINDFLHDKYRDFIKSYGLLPPEEKVKAYTSLLKYSIPALQSTREEVNFNDLSEPQLDYLIDCISNGKKPLASEVKELKNNAA